MFGSKGPGIGVRYQLVLLTGVLILAVSAALGAMKYARVRDTLLAGIDDMLLKAAHLAAAIVPEDYHDKLVDKSSMPPEDYDRLVVERHNRLCKKLGLQYLWSCMLLPSGDIVFTTSTSPSHDVTKQDHAKFWDVHRDPRAFNGVFGAAKLREMKPDFSSFHNEWGHGRMVLVPMRDAQGRPYCYGASVSIESVLAQLRDTFWRSVGVSAAAVAFGMLLSLGLAESLARPLGRLTRVAEAISSGDLEQTVAPRGSREMRSLARALATMSQAIREKLAALRAEIAERRKAQEEARRQAAILQAINTVFQTSLTCKSEEEVARAGLAVATALTGSGFGFVGELNQKGRLDTLALSDPGWETCRIPESQAARMIHDMEVRGLWGAVIQSAQPVLANEPAAHPAAVGLPEGHPPLTAFLGVPLRLGGKAIGVIGVANKAGGYEPGDASALEALSVALVEALMRVRAEAEVRKARDELEVRVQERTAELARSNAELEQFAYVASHDLQEPLRMVTSFVQLLAERYQGKLGADADEFIGFAVDGATRMRALINDLLVYSRVGQSARALEAVPCEEVIARVINDLRGALEESGGRLTHGPLPTVLGDETQVGQLLRNLVGNALKFRRAEPPEVHVAAVRQGGEWLFSVRDNGIGIAPEHIGRLFVMFRRLHTRQEYPGTGLGLALCKKIVERHGGRIWVESTPGQGSTFFFTLPAAAP